MPTHPFRESVILWDLLVEHWKHGDFLDQDGNFQTLSIDNTEGVAFREDVRYLKSLGAVICIIGNEKV